MRLVRRFDRRLREIRIFVRAMHSDSHPILAQIVPIRRCNLDCAYCNEYDKTSAPVPLETMLRRIDRLADLGTTIITLSGGEPTLHPHLDAIIRRIRERGAIAMLIGIKVISDHQEKTPKRHANLVATVSIFGSQWNAVLRRSPSCVLNKAGN